MVEEKEQEQGNALFDMDMTPEEFNDIPESGFISIPTRDGIEREGDSVTLMIETSSADWKTPDKSLAVPVTVIEEGENYGKTIDIYPPAGSKADIKGIGITKRLAKCLGVYDKVFPVVDGKQKLNLLGFAGGKGLATFKRTMSVPQGDKAGQPGILRSTLAAVDIAPLAEKTDSLGV